MMAAAISACGHLTLHSLSTEAGLFEVHIAACQCNYRAEDKGQLLFNNPGLLQDKAGLSNNVNGL